MLWIWTRTLPAPAWRKRLSAGLLSIFLGGFALEFASATGWVDWSRALFGLLAGTPGNARYSARFLADDALGFRRPPGLHWKGPVASDLEQAWGIPASSSRPLSFTYDDRGYRNPTPVEKADILLLGDSFAEGWYVSDEETVARRLESRLGRTVANLGVAGYGLRQEAMVLAQELPRLRPSLVIWFFYEGNDFYNDDAFEKTLDYLASRSLPRHGDGSPANPSAPWRSRALTPNVLRLCRFWAHPLVPNRIPYVGLQVLPDGTQTQVAFAGEAAVPWSDWVSNRWAQAQLTLAGTSARCRDAGVRLLVCYLPVKYRVYRDLVRFPADSPCRNWTLWPLPALLADFGRAQDLAVLDLTPGLQQAAAAGEMPFAPMDSHWGPAGHDRVASLVEGELRKRGW